MTTPHAQQPREVERSLHGCTAASIVVVQYAGDYREAYLRLAGGGPETYYAQRYSIDAVGALVGAARRVATICCTCEDDYDEVLANGVRAIGLARTDAGVDESKLWARIRDCQPTHLLLRTPLRHTLQQAVRSKLNVMLTLADSFNGSGLRARFRHWRLRRLLNAPAVVCVGNHGINASRSLLALGVTPSKVVAWDWPHALSPNDFLAKSAPRSQAWSLLFVGIVCEEKGVGDLVRAVALLQGRGRDVHATVVGRGDIEGFSALASSMGVGDKVKFRGQVSHAQIVPLMREADLLVVPSRHDYPEGFPMTIYEGLTSRTPIVASDHPMFRGRLEDRRTAMVFKAGDASGMASAVATLMDSPALYEALSEASLPAWEALQIPVKWGDLVRSWAAPERPGDLARLLAHGVPVT